jgi:beta-xylosidase
MTASAVTEAYLRPVFDGYFADPFIWSHQGVYYAIGTGAREAAGHVAGKVFPVLHSKDLISWQILGDALVAPARELGDTFWAPAVAELEGKFYLYYSVGHGDRGHQLRVAISTAPEGPYQDQGRPLLPPQQTPFCIDPHPFQDVDGQWYLFYASDFLDTAEEQRAGTALMVRRMKNMCELEPEGYTVLRARSDWQRFQSGRRMYGAVWDWHTLEGPCVIRHGGRYVCFYSGGRWEDATYGVDYGVSDHVLGPYHDHGNEKGPRVLRTRPGCLIGPGHNSWVLGPDGTEYLCFHAWNPEVTARGMYLGKLLWSAEGPVCEVGPQR